MVVISSSACYCEGIIGGILKDGIGDLIRHILISLDCYPTARCPTASLPDSPLPDHRTHRHLSAPSRPTRLSKPPSHSSPSTLSWPLTA